MKRFLLLCLAWVGICLMLTDVAFAEKRLALVIGINDYREVPKLEKAVGDATAIGDKLATLGFSVTKVLNPDRRTLNLALTNLYKIIEPGDTVLIHYSGHGVEIDKQNYLLPADIPNPESGDSELLKAESLPLSTLVDTLKEKGAGVRIFIIDACRDNPFAKAGKRALGTTRGLAAVEPPKGSFIMYSAGTGQSALDRLSDNDPSSTSVYTRVLLKHFGEKGLALRDLAADVRKEVDQLSKSVGHEQSPAYYDEMTIDFTFLPGDAKLAATDNVPPVVVVTPPPQQTASGISEEQAYKMSEGINTVEAWDIFLKQYPAGLYAPYATAARQKLTIAAKPRATTTEQITPKVTPIQPKPPKKKLASTGCSSSGRVRGLPPDDNFLSVRTGPGVGFNEITRLFNGDRVSICGRSGRWLRITGSGAAGWVSGKYVAIGG